MASNIPLIGAPQQAPTYPQVNLNLIPQGMSIQIALGPTTTISQLIDANTMDQIAIEWRKSRRNSEDLLRVVQSSKL